MGLPVSGIVFWKLVLKCLAIPFGDRSECIEYFIYFEVGFLKGYKWKWPNLPEVLQLSESLFLIVCIIRCSQQYLILSGISRFKMKLCYALASLELFLVVLSDFRQGKINVWKRQKSNKLQFQFGNDRHVKLQLQLLLKIFKEFCWRMWNIC